MSDRMMLWVLAGLIAIGLYLLRPRTDSASDARIAQLEAQIGILQQEVAQARAASNRAVDKVGTRKHALQVADTVIRLGLKSATRAVQDTTLPVDSLRIVLDRLVTKVTMYQAEVLRYQESVDSLLQAHLAERTAYEMNMQAVQASVPTPCTYLGVRCPNRTTAFLLGVGSALILAVAVAF